MFCYYTYVLIDPRDGQPFYVGKGTKQRMYQHVYRRHALANRRLRNRINQIINGDQKVLYEKIIDCVSEGEALTEEIRLIEKYGRLDLGTGILCNLTGGGERGATTWGPETRERKRQIELAKRKGRPVSQYTLEGKHIMDYPSAKVASEHTLANRSYITQVCKGKRVSAGGFLWTYQGEPTPVFFKQYHRPVSQYSIDGELIASFYSLTEAQNKTGIELHNISECCRGKSKTAGGYLWKYILPQPF